MSPLSLPGFDILEPLRETSKTLTVKAIQRSLDRTVALSFLRPAFESTPSEIQRFLSVARVCSQMKASGFPQIYDIANDGDRPYIVFEHVEGQSVAEIVRQKGPMPSGQALRIVLAIAEGLNLAWKQNRLVHRNIKPSEIRVDPRGTAKLSDFGRAIVVRTDGSIADDEESGLVVGTPNFLSPEQVRDSGRIDCRADIYALGATLYYMITGCVPFPTGDPESVLRLQLTDQIPHPRTFRADLPAPIGGLLTRMMMKQPEDRYVDWTEAMGDMQRALKNLPLRLRESAPTGISTIAASVAAPPPESPQLRRVESSSSAAKPRGGIPVPPAGTSPTPPHGSRPSGPALYVRVVFWILLGVWLVLVSNDRLENKLLHLPVSTPLIPLDRWVKQLWQTIESSTSPVTTPVAPPVAVNPPSNAPTLPTPAPTPAPAKTVPSPPTPQPPTPSVQTPVQPIPPTSQKLLPPDVVKRLAATLGQGDWNGARAVLASTIPLPASRLREYSDAVEAIPDPLRLAEETLLKSVGQEVTITYMGKERRIIPKSSANGTIEANFVSSDGPRPVMFKTTRFTPDEIVKLLPEAATPAHHATWCIALLKARRKDEAAKHATQCGLLSPVFDAAVAAAAEPTP